MELQHSVRRTTGTNKLQAVNVRCILIILLVRTPSTPPNLSRSQGIAIQMASLGSI